MYAHVLSMERNGDTVVTTLLKVETRHIHRLRLHINLRWDVSGGRILSTGTTAESRSTEDVTNDRGLNLEHGSSHSRRYIK